MSTTGDSDEERLLTKAARDLGVRPQASSKDRGGVHGYWITVAGERALLVAKKARYQGRVSVSLPAVKAALPDAPIVVWIRAEGRAYVFDPVDVAEARRGIVDSKRVSDLEVCEIVPGQGTRLSQYR